jgi:hypothetical protein
MLTPHILRGLSVTEDDLRPVRLSREGGGGAMMMTMPPPEIPALPAEPAPALPGAIDKPAPPIPEQR